MLEDSGGWIWRCGLEELVRLDIKCSEDRGEQACLCDVSTHPLPARVHARHETYIDEICIDLLDPSLDERLAISLSYGSCLRESLSLFFFCEYTLAPLIELLTRAVNDSTEFLTRKLLHTVMLYPGPLRFRTKGYPTLAWSLDREPSP